MPRTYANLCRIHSKGRLVWNWKALTLITLTTISTEKLMKWEAHKVSQLTHCVSLLYLVENLWISHTIWNYNLDWHGIMRSTDVGRPWKNSWNMFSMIEILARRKGHWRFKKKETGHASIARRKKSRNLGERMFQGLRLANNVYWIKINSKSCHKKL